MPDTRPTFYGSFRESNAVPLQVPAPPILAGLPLEVDVYDGSSPATMLATLEAARAASFAVVKDDVGSGQFTLPADDPKAVHLQTGNIVKFKLGGVYRFAIVLDEPKLIPAAEGSAARYEVGGQGVGIMLDRAVLYLEHTFASEPLGAILHTVVSEQLLKTPSPLPHLTVDFNDTTDSDGAVWTDTATLGLSKGASVLDVWKQLVSLGLDSRVTHTLKLQAYRELGVHRDGTSSSDPVVLRQGRHFTVDPELVGRGAGSRSRVLVIGEGGASFEVIDASIESNPLIGRRETALSFGSADPTTMQRAGTALLRSLQLESEALKLPVVHGLDPGDYEPWVDYDVGDWVLIDIPGKLELAPMRVVGMQVDQGDTPFDWGLTLDLNSYSLEADLRLKRQLDALGGSQVSGGGVNNVSLGSSNVSGTSSSGKASVESGDTPGYLYGKVDAVSPIVKAIVGSSGNRQLQLGFAGLGLDELLDVDTVTTPPDDGQALVYDDASGLWVPGDVASGGGGGTPLSAPDYTEANAQVSASSSQDILTRTITLPAGRYLLIGKAWIWSVGVGTLNLTATVGTLSTGTTDPRTDVAERILFGYHDHPGGSVTYAIRHNQESGTTQYGSGGDPRFGRELLIVPLASTGGSSGAPSYLGYNVAGATAEVAVARRHWVKRVTVPVGGCIASIGAYLRLTSPGSTPTVAVFVMADVAGAPTDVLAAGPQVVLFPQSTVLTPTVAPARWVDFPVTFYNSTGAPLDVWIGMQTQAASISVYKDTGGTDRYFTPTTSGYTSDAYPSWPMVTTTDRYSLRALLLG